MKVSPSFRLLCQQVALVVWAASLLSLVTTSSLQCQVESIPSHAPDQGSAVIRVASRLVQVSVIAENRKGVPITGLKKEDFALLDEGKPQEIAFVSSSAPVRTISRPRDKNVFSNYSGVGLDQGPGATVIILFDALNTSFEDQAYARQHVLRFLQSVKPQDRVAIFALTTELIVLHDFTEDAESLRSSVGRFSPRLLAAFDGSHPDNFHVPALANDPSWARFEARVNNANGEIADSFVIDRFRITYAAIEAIAKNVVNISGHKSLVWVSDGIPIQIGAGHIGAADRDNFRFDDNAPPGSGTRDMNSLSRALNRANMAIYPIDAHGIDTDDSAAGFFMRQDQRDSFRLLADNTGGHAFYGTNDLAGAITSAVDDDRSTYTIGFYPDHGIWDGSFHEIKISLPIPGSRLRYRRGYYAFQEPHENEARMRADLQEAARSPLDATGLEVAVKGKTLVASSGRLLQLQVTLDPKQFSLRDQDHRKKGGLDLLFVEKGSAGNFLTAEKQHFDIDLKRKEYDSLAKAGLVLQRRLAITPTSSAIRVLVRDAGSGAMGSVTIPVDKLLLLH
jgi:VWFA-related protein